MIKRYNDFIKIIEGLDEFKYKPINVNKFVYHQSNPIFRDKISKEGLIPKGKSESWLSNTKIDGEVIFASNSDNSSDWFDSTYDDDIYKIDTTGLKNKWYLDPNFNGDNYVITFQNIPVEAIELVYKGTGKSKDSTNDFSIIEYKPKHSVKNYKGYKLLSDGLEVAYMLGLKDGKDFILDGIKVENEYRGKNLGELLIIEYLKKYGGEVISNSKGKRSSHAEKMWERISKRTDVNIRMEKVPYPFTPGYLNHYWVSLK